MSVTSIFGRITISFTSIIIIATIPISFAITIAEFTGVTILFTVSVPVSVPVTVPVPVPNISTINTVSTFAREFITAMMGTLIIGMIQSTLRIHL